ncbi:MAG: hypothetical protein QM706_12390 [Nitrospira sp.]
MSTAWWLKASPRRKGSLGKRQFRWNVLGLHNPAEASSPLSIEEVRRQIISASRYGLSPETLTRSREKNGRPQRGPKSSAATRKRGAAPQ